MEYLFWYHYLILISLLICIPPFFLKNNPYPKIHLIIFVVLFMVALLEIFAVNLARRGINNSVYYNLFFVYLETLLLLYFFAAVFKEKKVNLMIFSFAVIFLGWGTINSFFLQSIFFFQTYSFAMGSLLLIGCCIYFFYGIIYKEWYSEKSLLSIPMFWIISGIMLFYSCSFLYFTSMRMIYEMDKELVRSLDRLNQIISASMYVIMGMAFYAPFLFKNNEEFKQSGQIKKFR